MTLKVTTEDYSGVLSSCVKINKGVVWTPVLNLENSVWVVYDKSFAAFVG